MKNMQLESMCIEVRLYIICTQGTQYEQSQLQEFLTLLSKSLQEKVSIEIFTTTIKHNLELWSAIMEISRNFIGPKEEVTEQKKKLIFDIVTRFET